MVIEGCRGLPVRRHDVSLLIQLKGAGTRVGDLAIRLFDLEEPLTLNHQVERVPRVGCVPLSLKDFGRSGAGSQSDLESR